MVLVKKKTDFEQNQQTTNYHAKLPSRQSGNEPGPDIFVLYDFLVTVKAAPHECVIRTGQP